MHVHILLEIYQKSQVIQAISEWNNLPFISKSITSVFWVFFAFTANLFSIQGQGVLAFNLFFVQLPTVAFLD